MNKNNDQRASLQTWQIIVLIGVLFIALVLGILQMMRPDGAGTPLDNGPAVVLNAASCAAAGGSWNECGSACRGASDETACIQVCVEYCECTSAAQCPFGSSCVNYIEGVGVCTNTF